MLSDEVQAEIAAAQDGADARDQQALAERLLDEVVGTHLEAEQLVDLRLRDDQRRRERDDVAGGADQDPLLVGVEEAGEGPLGRLAGDRFQLDRADQAGVAEADGALAGATAAAAGAGPRSRRCDRPRRSLADRRLELAQVDTVHVQRRRAGPGGDGNVHGA